MTNFFVHVTIKLIKQQINCNKRYKILLRGRIVIIMREREGTVYKGKHKLIDTDTGEIIEVDKIYRKQTSGNFVKAYIKGLVMMLEVTGGSKLKVVNYLLENLSLTDNVLVATVREIAESLKISPTTVTNTLKTLEDGNVIKRRTGAIMLNPEILYRGNDNKQRFLLVEFAQFDRKSEIEHARAEFESFNTVKPQTQPKEQTDEIPLSVEDLDELEQDYNYSDSVLPEDVPPWEDKG